MTLSYHISLINGTAFSDFPWFIPNVMEFPDGRKTASAKGFGGKDRVKENRQGFLSRRNHKISELVQQVLKFSSAWRESPQDFFAKLSSVGLRQKNTPAEKNFFVFLTSCVVCGILNLLFGLVWRGLLYYIRRRSSATETPGCFLPVFFFAE